MILSKFGYPLKTGFKAPVTRLLHTPDSLVFLFYVCLLHKGKKYVLVLVCNRWKYSPCLPIFYLTLDGSETTGCTASSHF